MNTWPLRQLSLGHGNTDVAMELAWTRGQRGCRFDRRRSAGAASPGIEFDLDTTRDAAAARTSCRPVRHHSGRLAWLRRSTASGGRLDTSSLYGVSGIFVGEGDRAPLRGDRGRSWGHLRADALRRLAAIDLPACHDCPNLARTIADHARRTATVLGPYLRRGGPSRVGPGPLSAECQHAGCASDVCRPRLCG